ncbi:hypothetical protein AAU61_14110 [Desulfocarbo indianensis]|nr:hypothetical protein AAU61_14110 [Desulfocarbo indianensis]
MSHTHDIIVTGLGPAGAMAGATLARAGAKVLILAGQPGHVKPCGGCLSRRWDWLLRELGLPAWVWRHPVRRLWLAAPLQPPVHWQSREVGAYLVDRARFNQALAQAALEAGAEVIQARAREALPRPGGFAVKSRVGDFSCGWLVAASGAGGAQALGLVPPQIGLLYRAIVEERPLPARLEPIMRDAALIELGGVPGGYGWAFARGDTLNLGMGFWQGNGGPGGYSESTAGLARAYQKFIKRHGLEPAHGWRGWVIPCPDGKPPQVVSGRACLAGDAAATGDPFLGEGMGQALYSGRLAAQAILAGDLGQYQARMGGLWREHRHGRLLARLIYGWPGLFQRLAQARPGAVELGFNVLRGELAQAGIWRALGAKLKGREPALDLQARGYYSKHLN